MSVLQAKEEGKIMPKGYISITKEKKKLISAMLKDGKSRKYISETLRINYNTLGAYMSDNRLVDISQPYKKVVKKTGQILEVIFCMNGIKYTCGI